MSITHVTPREMELQAEVTRLKAELARTNQAYLELCAMSIKERDELRAKLAALEGEK